MVESMEKLVSLCKSRGYIYILAQKSMEVWLILGITDL